MRRTAPKKKAVVIKRRSSLSQSALPDRKSATGAPPKRRETSDRSKSKFSEEPYFAEQKKPSELRKRAEEKSKTTTTAPKARYDKETRQLIHDLEVHQIELEMQNDELLRTQAKLEESRAKYSDLYDFAPVGYFTFDEHGLILEANLTAGTELGVERGLLLHKPFRKYIAPEYRNIFDQHLQKVFRSDERQTCELTLKRKDGNEFYAQIESIAMNDLKGNPRSRTSVSDITEHKQKERGTLRKSEDRFRTLVEAAPEAIFVQSQGVFIYLNRAMLSLLGASTSEELIGREFMKQMAPEYHEAIRERIRIQEKTGAPVPPMEQEYIRLDGSRVPVETTAVAVRFQDHDAHLVFVRDISQCKQSEKLLRESEEKYRLLFNGITDAVYVYEVSVEKPEKFMAVNHSACRMLGYTTDEFLQREVKDIDTPEHTEKIPSIHERLFRDGYALFETCHVAKDGRKIPVEINVRLFELKGKQLALAVVRDITWKQKEQEKIERYNTRIRNLVTQMALVEEKERRRIANILHDSIGQNLALSRIMLDELRAPDPSVPFSSSLDEITKIIDETMHYARDLTFQISSPILYELGLEAAIEWLGEKLLKRQNIVFECRNDRAPKPLTKEAPVLLFQAVRECYLNIIKHSKAHHVRAFIQKRGGKMHIRIEDDGIGFDTKALYSPASENLTYGLFSIRERISLIGGTLEIESTAGQGTRVTLIVPLAA